MLPVFVISLSPLYHWAALHLASIHTLSILIIRVVTHVNGLPELVFSLLLVRIVLGSNFLVALGRVISSPLMLITTIVTDSNRGVRLLFVSCLHKTVTHFHPHRSCMSSFICSFLHFLILLSSVTLTDRTVTRVLRLRCMRASGSLTSSQFPPKHKFIRVGSDAFGLQLLSIP